MEALDEADDGATDLLDIFVGWINDHRNEGVNGGAKDAMISSRISMFPV